MDKAAGECHGLHATGDAVAPLRAKKMAPRARLVSGPTMAITNSTRAERGSRWILDTPPNKNSVMSRTGNAICPGHQGMGQFMRKHGSEEEQRGDERRAPGQRRSPVRVLFREYPGRQVPHHQQEDEYPVPVYVKVNAKDFADLEPSTHDVLPHLSIRHGSTVPQNKIYLKRHAKVWPPRDDPA